MGFKSFMWKIGLKKEDECPLCKGVLFEHYSGDNFGSVFTCDNKVCGFGKC